MIPWRRIVFAVVGTVVLAIAVSVSYTRGWDDGSTHHVVAKNPADDPQNKGNVPDHGTISTPPVAAQHGGPVTVHPASDLMKRVVVLQRQVDGGKTVNVYACQDDEQPLQLLVGSNATFDGTDITTTMQSTDYAQPADRHYPLRGQQEVVVNFDRIYPATFQIMNVIVTTNDPIMGVTADGRTNGSNVIDHGYQDDKLVYGTTEMVSEAGFILPTSEFTTGSIVDVTLCLERTYK